MDNNASVLTNQSRFRGEVLNKIYRVWLFRKLLPVLLVEVVVLSAVLFFLGRSIFLQRVMENGLKVFFLNPPQIIYFLTDAFWGAPLVTKVFSVAVLVVLAFLVRHLTQGILRLILVRENYFSRVKGEPNNQ